MVAFSKRHVLVAHKKNNELAGSVARHRFLDHKLVDSVVYAEVRHAFVALELFLQNGLVHLKVVLGPALEVAYRL